jgi:hypothetical protein
MGHDILLTVLFGGARFGCGKQSRASLGVASMSSGRPYHPDDPDQQDRAYEAGNQVTDPSSQDDPEVAQNGAGNCRTDDASQSAIPPMMMAAIQPSPASPMAHLLENGHVAPKERLTIDMYQREALKSRVPAAPPTCSARTY